MRELSEEKQAAFQKIEDLKRNYEEERKKLLETKHVKVHPNVAVPSQSTQPVNDISRLVLLLKLQLK